MTAFEPLYSKINSHLGMSDEETAFFLGKARRKQSMKWGALLTQK
jgi:hypothetical protein